MLKYFSLIVLLLPVSSYASEEGKDSWIYIGGEFSRFSRTGFESRIGRSPLNINLNISQRVHSDVWLGVHSFLGHDPNPKIRRNYEQSIGLSTHWFPFSLSSDSILNHEGFNLTERELYRFFLSGLVSIGRARLGRVLDKFDVNAEFLGFGLGAGSHFAFTPQFAISASLNYQVNSGIGQVNYEGDKAAIALAAVFMY